MDNQNLSFSVIFYHCLKEVIRNQYIWIATVLLTDLGKLNAVKICIGGLVLGSSQFLLLFQLPQKNEVPLQKNGQDDSKIIVWLYLSNSTTHTVKSSCAKWSFEGLAAI
jgi:hypothetical protein